MTSIKTIFFTLILLLSASALSQSLRVVTENKPPLQTVTNDNVLTGAMVEIVNLLLAQANVEAPIEVYPWARSYQIASEQNNTLIFSMFRNKNREKKFQWIGKLLTVNSYLVSLKTEQNITINSISDAKKYSIGIIREDLAEHYLRENGFVENKNLYLNSDCKILWQMLHNGRTDLAFANDILWQYEVEYAGLDPSKFHLVYQVPNFATDLYIAASLDVDKTVVERIKSALALIKANGQYQDILNKWQLTPNKQTQ